MIVYSYYNPEPTAPREQARFIRLWSESWRKHGWTPLLLTERMAEEHVGYTRECRMLDKALLAVQHYNKPGIVVSSNMINFGLEPRRVAASGRSFYPTCVSVGNAMLREMRKTKCTRFTLDYRFDLISADVDACAPVKVFTDWNADRVMECLKKWR